jgi:ubiquinone biosynthesis O-methyltransferase
MNPVRVDFVRKSVAGTLHRTHLFSSQHLKGLNILDVGCGGGLLSESLARLGANMTSIDPSPENIQIAKAHSKLDPATATINYMQSTIGECFCLH